VPEVPVADWQLEQPAAYAAADPATSGISGGEEQPVQLGGVEGWEQEADAEGSQQQAEQQQAQQEGEGDFDEVSLGGAGGWQQQPGVPFAGWGGGEEGLQEDAAAGYSWHQPEAPQQQQEGGWGGFGDDLT
jgi:predicted secreted protein